MVLSVVTGERASSVGVKDLAFQHALQGADTGRGGTQAAALQKSAAWKRQTITHPRLVELVGHAAGVGKNNLPVTDDQQQEQRVKAYQQNDARRRIHGPERQRGEEDEAVVHERNDHEHHN